MKPKTGSLEGLGFLSVAMADAPAEEKGADLHTVFVRGLPYTLTDAQLEEAFSDVGPVRRAFTVKEKATNEHRGFGFVQFAVAEDAQRAVETKNEEIIEGRKIKVEIAKKRPPPAKRKRKEQKEKQEAEEVEVKAPEEKSAPSNAEEKLRKKKKQKIINPNTPGTPAASQKQKPARTVVIGGLSDEKTLNVVEEVAKLLGDVESIDKDLSEAYVNDHGLSRDGCKMPAIAIIFTSVRAAKQAVATLHNRKIDNHTLWARQLGGEGSKLKKWRLIVRNLPFKVTEEILREAFETAGFIWEITIPRKPDGQSKGFAFIGYTSKSDAEKAIKELNGKKIAGRTVAVDWSVAKKKYETIKPQEGEDNNEENDLEKAQTASESDDESVYSEEEKAVDETREPDLLKKVLDKFVADPPKQQEEIKLEEGLKPIKSKQSPVEKIEDKEDNPMDRTLFVRNIPIDSKVNDLRKKFSEFGDVSSFRLVLHPATKKPKGTAFLEYVKRESAEALIEAADKQGVIIGGKPIITHFAVDRNAARSISTKKSIEEQDNDRRNLYLLKEGYIEPGTKAAEGVSKSDLMKRQALQTEKTTKLRSPNFHVSKTRLAIHNFPKSLSEKEIKQLFIKAVISRATKQHPVIKQVKLLTDEKGNSRGTGFVEFTEHQHALVALRVLNNNPDTFGSEKRPIVEFAIENVAKLRKREARLALSKLKSKEPQTEEQSEGFADKASKRKRKQADKKDSQEAEENPRKQKKSRIDVQDSESKGKQKPQGNFKKQKKVDKQKDGNKNKQKQQSKDSESAKPNQKQQKKQKVKADATAKGNQKQQDEEVGVKKRRKGKKEELEDKLDKLVDEYRTKYYNTVQPGTKENIKRWFE